MSYLCIQLQHDHDPKVSVDEVVMFLKRIGYQAEINSGFESGYYSNILIDTNDLKGLWLSIKPYLFVNKNYSESCIITCEGSQGWDNYLILHHFNSTISLDCL